MRQVQCPICDNKNLILVDDDQYVNFDLRKATNRVFCVRCKRNIRYSIVQRNSITSGAIHADDKE